MNVVIRTPGNQETKMYIDTECPKCGATYTGTLKKMGKAPEEKE
jgi:hypothetical protein